MVLHGKHIPISDENQDSTLHIFERHSFSTHVHTSYEKNVDDVHVIPYDHQKEIREN